jgi:hypothetical protein
VTLRRCDLNPRLATAAEFVLGGTIPAPASRIQRRLDTTAHVADLGEPAHRISHAFHHLPGRSRRPACRSLPRASTETSKTLWRPVKGTVPT